MVWQPCKYYAINMWLSSSRIFQAIASCVQRRMCGPALIHRSQWRAMRSWRLSLIQAVGDVAMFCVAEKKCGKKTHDFGGFSGHLRIFLFNTYSIL